MRYVPRQPREGINVSKTHPLAEAGLLVGGLGLLFVILAVVLVFAIDIGLRYVSAEQESALFKNWMPEDLITVAPDDERLVALQSVVDRLASHWPDSPYAFRIEINASEESNAMAFPGGLIVVTEGLLQQVESENELAFVLGHELGHYHNRDHLRALGRGAILTLVFVIATGGDVSNIGIAVADLTLKGFGRKQETLADAFGLQLMNEEYGHVAEASRLFLRWRDDAMPGGMPTYLSTHPSPANRVENLNALSKEQGWKQEGAIHALPWR